MTPAALARQAADLIDTGDHAEAIERLQDALAKLAGRRTDPDTLAAEIRTWAGNRGVPTIPADTLPLAAAARYLNVEPQSLRNAARRYGLRLVRINGRTRIPISDMAAHVARQVNYS